MKNLLLLLAVTLIGWKTPIRAAQNAAPGLQIIDVLPSVDQDQSIPNWPPMVSCDFLIGARNRPAWWGQSFNGGGKIDAQLEVTQNGQTTRIAGLMGGASVTSWHEGLGLYLFHARFGWGARKWPREARYVLRGTLTPPLPQSQPMPFALSFAAPAKGQWACATLDSPQAQVWVRSIRVAPRENYYQDGQPNFPYEARITVAGRRIEKQTETRYAPEFFDLTGKEPSPMSGGWGLEGGLGHDHEIANQLVVGSGVEFLTYRVVFSEGVFGSSPDLFFRQTLEVGGRAPLTVSFPVKRGGVLLSGEIAPREWQFGENK